MIPTNMVTFRMIELALVYNDVVPPSTIEHTTRMNNLGMNGSLTSKVISFLNGQIKDQFDIDVDLSIFWFDSDTIGDLVKLVDFLIIDLLVDSIFDD